MTRAEELRAALSREAIWMASEAVRRGCEAARATKKESLKQRALESAGQRFDFTTKHAYYEGVRIAAEVLWRLFDGCSATVQTALRQVAKETDYTTRDEAYFDRFVEAYEAENGSIRIRVSP